MPHSEVGYFDVIEAHLPPVAEALRSAPGAPPLTKSGVRGYPGVDPAQLLLFQTMLRRKARGPILDLSPAGGLLAALPGAELRPAEGSAPALRALDVAGLNPVAAALGDDLSGYWEDPARTVACVLAGDRGTAYALGQISWAHAHTPPGGKLYLAGDKAKGFDRYVRAASKAYGAGETIARDGGMRVAVLTRRPGPTPALADAEHYELGGVKVVGLPGVFSAGRADKATSLLLETLEGLDLRGKAVLDLGCGTGLIGAWAAQRGAAVTLADADLQSVRSAQLTLEANGVSGEVVHSDVDGTLGERRFDMILSNPPFHVGRGVVLDVAREFIAAAARRLRPGGQLILVANDFLPYEAEMSVVGATEVLAHEQGFKVLAVRRAGSRPS
ncbi:class I SAM-dependent methyltransferase [Deinococcus radiophilus]|uniref:Class I SAM-dependent methyltransferase n=1 Tax=Deinococcus radiophilus TaxID=32062 RepID=A0A3S0KI38_9DEIO|nr:class I SAM-dependent methyltransferase [Deinococcus radiophilus]